MNDELLLAIRQLATERARTYDGFRERSHILTTGYELVEDDQLAPVLALAEQHGVPADEDVLRKAFADAFVAAVMAQLKRGPHELLAPAWAPVGPADPDAAWTPPAAKSLSGYVIAWDEGLGGFVYAIEPDSHQFGHAWLFGGGAWRPLSAHTYRLGSATQGWTGAYDPDRGGVVGWNLDGDRPVGVLVTDGGLTVIAAAEAFDPDEPTEGAVERTALDVPEVESDWEDLAALFGHDRARHVWVMLCPQGVYELDTADRWTHVGELPDDVIPDEPSGDRDHGSTDGAGAVWDARRQQVVFWFAADDEDEDRGKTIRFAAWDGATLVRLDGDGLPAELLTRDGGALVASHPELGVVAYAGPGDGLFHLTDGGWVATSLGASPPKSLGGSLGFAPSGDALLGPARFGKSPDRPDEEPDQHGFYARRGDAWTRLGAIRRKHPLAALSDWGTKALLIAGRRELIAVSSRSLHTLAWTDADGWQTLVDGAAGKQVFDELSPEARYRVALASGPDGAVIAVSSQGAIAVRDGDGWRALAEESDGFGKRTDFLAAYDPVHARVVVWGGSCGDRDDVHDTLAWHDGAWRRLPSGPRPPDLRFTHSSHGFRVHHLMYFDTALERVVRIGYEEIAVLDGDHWRGFKDPRFTELLSPAQRTVAHDPVTGETLVIGWGEERVVRLDLAAPDHVATITERPAADRDADAAQSVRDSIAVADVAGRRLLGFPTTGPLALDLAPVFALARSLGPRQTVLPPAAPDPIRLYRDRGDRIEAWFADASDHGVRVRHGDLRGALVEEHVAGELDALAAGARADGYVTADALTADRLAILGRPVWELTLVDDDDDDDDDDDSDDSDDSDAAASADAALSTSRIGGGPSGLAIADWPHDGRGRPMAFLYQVALPAELGGGGCAVFVITNGTCTEEDEHNTAVRLTDAQLAAPPTAAPAGVPIAAPSTLTIGARGVEFGRPLVERLAAEDPVLGDALESLGGKVGTGDKLGGFPAYVQAGDPEAVLVGQLDFDTISLDDEGWSEIGLAGVLYVFRDGDTLRAGWQGT